MTDHTELAIRFTAMCLKNWTAKGLPIEPLAQAFTAAGLTVAAARDTPAVTANALRDLADDIDTAKAPPSHGSC
ncbi:hypothetical protein [Brevundimonas sp. DC300-4]|uniref:hypothetical protein n=1 Tax=Brevundimonas sp. DC300-4 TaxID=2804594 RepID=UPI003CECEDFE